MPLQIGALSPIIPVTREVFGPEGKGSVVAQVDRASAGPDAVGLLFTDGRDLWTHPGLLTEENRLKGLCWYRLSLEGAEVVMRQDPTRASGRTDARTFRAPPLTLASTPVDALVRLIATVDRQRGRCGCGDGCQHENDRMDAIRFRDAVLVELERHSGRFQAVCGRCYDALAAQDTRMRDEQTMIDGRRILPHAALQILASPG